MDVAASVGAAANGQEYLIMPIGTCSFEAVVTCPGTTPGNIIALTLSAIPANAIATTVTSTAVSTSVSTTTVAGAATTVTTATTVTNTASGGGVDNSTLYGVAAVAVIFIIATGFLAMRGRKRSP